METNLNPLQKQMLDDVFDAFSMLVSGAIVSLMHVDGGVTRYTRQAVDLFGLPGEYIPNGAYDWNDYLHPEDRKRYMDVMIPLLEGKAQTYDITYRVRTKSGEYGMFRAVGGVLRGQDGKPSMIGGAMFNEGMARNVDPVTVLPNKHAYMEDFSRSIAEGKSSISLLVGFNGLAEINQLHGYTYGNKVLQEVSLLIQEIAKDSCDIYRMDGSTFALATDTLSKEQVSAIYDMIRYRLQRGVEVNSIQNSLMASGGMMSIYSADTDASTLTSCLRYAYEESKDHKHGELVDFNGSINFEGISSLQLINSLRASIRDDCKGFIMEYHPVIDAKTGGVNGAEATVAWESEEYGRVAPEEFMPILEHDFLFDELGDFLIWQGLREGAKLLERDPKFLLCLNIYRLQLESDFFIETLTEALEETGFPAPLLSLKLASDCRYIESSRMHDIIGRLHDMGILLIIDGFGSGTDSIAFLKATPVDAVCLDKQFLENVKESKRDRDILEYLTKMAVTCVEHINVKGVDSQELLDIVKEFPVTTIQGELFTKPLVMEELMEKYY